MCISADILESPEVGNVSQELTAHSTENILEVFKFVFVGYVLISLFLWARNLMLATTTLSQRIGREFTLRKSVTIITNENLDLKCI